MPQALSGLTPFAWGEVTVSELVRLNRLHQRLMWLGSTLPSARAFASHALAYLLLTLEAKRSDAAERCGSLPRPSAPALATVLAAMGDEWAPGTASGGAAGESRTFAAPRVLAVFAHDFNLLYLRQLLRVHWVTEPFDMDIATTGSSLLLELHGPGVCEREGDARSDGAANASTWRVIGRLTAASIEQQRSARPLIPPHSPPSVATVLDMDYEAFKARVLHAISPTCVREPLRTAVLALQREAAGPARPDDSRALSPLAMALLCIGTLLLGCTCGLASCMPIRGLLRRLWMGPAPVPQKRFLEMTAAVPGPAEVPTSGFSDKDRKEFTGPDT